MLPVEQAECQSDLTLHTFEHRVDMYMCKEFLTILMDVYMATCTRMTRTNQEVQNHFNFAVMSHEIM